MVACLVGPTNGVADHFHAHNEKRGGATHFAEFRKDADANHQITFIFVMSDRKMLSFKPEWDTTKIQATWLTGSYISAQADLKSQIAPGGSWGPGTCKVIKKQRKRRP